MSVATTRVAVIGAGPLGLLALKQFREDGFDATGFESRGYVGGLWKDSTDDNLSVQGTTIFNTSKLRAQASDFAFPDSADTFPTATQIHEYLESYAAHFGLLPHIKLNTKVKTIRRENGLWKLTLHDSHTDTEYSETFDKVCVATGTFFTPRWPRFDGIEQFTGNVIHSIKFHDGVPFQGKNVLIIGLHATTQDCVNSLAGHANQVFISHRRGVTFMKRWNEDQTPMDSSVGLSFMFLQCFMERNFPSLWTWLFDKLVAKMSAKSFPNLPESWGLRPAPSLSITTPLMADGIWPHLESGFAEPVAAVQKITGPKSVELTNGRVLDDIDAIIYCTGYYSELPKDLIPQPQSNKSSVATDSKYHPYPNGPGTPPYLFLNSFPLVSEEDVRNSLCFLGHGGIASPGFSQFEVWAMATSQIWQGKSKLPPLPEMIKWYEDNCTARDRLTKKHNIPADSTFYTVLLPTSKVFPWLDAMAGTGLVENLGGWLGGLFNAKTWQLWWHDRELYKLVTKGIFSPTVWRVFDMGGRKPLPRDEVVRRLHQANEALKRDAEIRREELAMVEKKIV